MKKLLLLALVIVIVCTGCLLIKNLLPGTPGSGSPEGDFAAFRAKKMKLPARQEPVCLVAVGDIMLSRGVAGEIKKQGGDPLHPFAIIKYYLKSGDIVFGNLENPITPGREIMMPEMTLRADPGSAQALQEAGFSVLSLANNHLADFGSEGLLDTLRYLDEAGIGHAGAGENEEEAFAAAFSEVNGLKLAFLAFTDPAIVPDAYLAGVEQPGIAFLEQEKVRAAVQDARRKADFVVVSIHAGREYESEPDLAQTQFARLAVDAGADLVLGHHPHVVQKIEQYKGKYIIYSLGNFIFDQKWFRATRVGLAVKIFIAAGGVERMEFMPVFINDQDQPQPLEGEDAAKVIKKLGLQTAGEAYPAWDPESRVFKESTRYTFYANDPKVKSRLIKNRHFDLDQDGACEDFALRDGKLMVAAGTQTVWQSPDEWWVDDFFLGDANNDGVPELNLLIWKSGSYGHHKPFWVTQEDMNIKNHLFIFKLAGGVIKPVWQSSNLDRPNYEAALADLDGDGKNELVVTEGDYADPGRREPAVWKWNGWGFSKIAYGEPQDT
ncbi:CapA family protein [Pelotomaculum propionicicum]|uniref:Capsule biosynthesis protein CapA n=1 Tax=Pelotomaculum propionicicum TaxID=258475 RepID=A0A4Y7RP58_9FIRM|nr:CapA family protein [Pelotomaculum propionicicum]TEB10784.1 Capsule biosynthesis protein CapA [Pelotomaculum propionicicum]